MENTNLSQNQAIPATETPQEKKSQQREKDRDLRINDLTNASFNDVIPKKNTEIVEIIESSPTKSIPNVQDEVQIFSPHLKERPAPLGTFASDLLPDFIKNMIKQMGFTAPTPIQNYCKILYI